VCSRFQFLAWIQNKTVRIMRNLRVLLLFCRCSLGDTGSCNLTSGSMHSFMSAHKGLGRKAPSVWHLCTRRGFVANLMTCLKPHYTKKGISTGWSRGNACFSYKNNFVYFQHKQILITQKRTNFNAFLKYVPNYVRKIMCQMMSFLPDTHSEPLLKVLHLTLQHFLRHSYDFLTNGKIW